MVDWKESTAETRRGWPNARCKLQKQGAFVLDEFANIHRVVAAARLVAVAGARLVAFFGLAVEVVVGVIAAAPALVAPLSSRELIVSFAHVHAQLRGNRRGKVRWCERREWQGKERKLSKAQVEVRSS